MAAVRMMARNDSADALPTFRAATLAARAMPGCLQAEDFAGVETSDHLLHVELWDSPSAWDSAWKVRRDAPLPVEAGIELYRQARFAPTGPAWVAIDDGVRSETIRWAATPGAIRILIQVAADPLAPAAMFIRDSIETREEPGCVAFEYFRSLDYEENVALIESWASPEIYDIHWRRRIAQGAPPPPPPPPRRYGETSFEWYAESHYMLAEGVWVSADQTRRMETVRW